MREDSAPISALLARRDAQCACRWKKKAEPRLIRQQITGGSPPISKQFRTKWMEKEIPPNFPSKVEHAMRSSREAEKAKGNPKARPEIG